MNATKISNEIVQQLAESGAWEQISSNYQLTEAMLDKHAEKLNWEKVSRNSWIQWTIPMVDKFKKKINWEVFSAEVDDKFLNMSTLEAFKDLWDWDSLSVNRELTLEMLSAYADRFNWDKIIEYGGYCGLFSDRGISFYEKYKEYIPEAQLLGSRLWKEIVAQARKQLEETLAKG